MRLPKLNDLDPEGKEKYLENLLKIYEEIENAILKMTEVIPLYIEESEKEIHYFIVHGDAVYHSIRRERTIEPRLNDETEYKPAEFISSKFFDNFVQKAKEANISTYLIYSPTPRLTVEKVLRYVEIDLGIIKD